MPRAEKALPVVALKVRVRAHRLGYLTIKLTHGLAATYGSRWSFRNPSPHGCDCKTGKTLFLKLESRDFDKNQGILIEERPFFLGGIRETSAGTPF